MKKSIIRQMFDGEKGNYEEVSSVKIENKHFKDAVKYENALREKLSATPELLELYNRAEKAIELSNHEVSCAYYIEGFKFGLLMGVEAAKSGES